MENVCVMDTVLNKKWENITDLYKIKGLNNDINYKNKVSEHR